MEELRKLWWEMEQAKAAAAKAVSTYNVAYFAALRAAGLKPTQELDIWTEPPAAE